MSLIPKRTLPASSIGEALSIGMNHVRSTFNATEIGACVRTNGDLGLLSTLYMNPVVVMQNFSIPDSVKD